MPGSATAEVYFIAAMMVLILIICVVAVFAFFKTYKSERREREQAAKPLADNKDEPSAE